MDYVGADPVKSQTAERLTQRVTSEAKPGSIVVLHGNGRGYNTAQALPAISAGSLAGIISVRYPWLRGPYLELLGLFPDYQGVGLGSELLRWFEQQARLANPNAWVLVSAFNHKARAFYERRGFVAIGAIEALVKPGYDEILLRKVVKKTVGQ